MKQLTILSFAALVGCASSANTRPTAAELHEGLNLLDVSDPSWGVTAAFRQDQHVVYLEQRVGALKPQAYRDQAPQEPANEIDLRFVDETGKTFFVQRGGDEYVDPTWASEINATIKNPAPDDQRVRDFALARDAASAFAQVASAKELAPFAFHAQAYAARPLPSEDPAMIARAAKIELSRQDTSYAYWGAGGSWWLEGDLYDHPQCVLWICKGRHSGVAMWAYQTSWQLAINACNHGSCPGSSNMNYECYSNGGWFNGASLSAETSTNSSVGGGCLTSYSWNSGSNNHLCNDDSAYELWQIKNGNSGSSYTYGTGGDGWTFTYTGAGTGGDGTWVNYACNCSNNNGCNNDWSRPICP